MFEQPMNDIALTVYAGTAVLVSLIVALLWAFLMAYKYKRMYLKLKKEHGLMVRAAINTQMNFELTGPLSYLNKKRP